jgi:dCMP deaminase
MNLIRKQTNNKGIAKDIYYMNIAIAVATKSTCLDKQVGAIVVSPEGKVIATGYNGAPCGIEHCTTTDNCLKKENQPCIAVHAEANAIVQATQSLKGSTIYVTHSPCLECTKLIINAGIDRIVAWSKYSKHTIIEPIYGSLVLCPEYLIKAAFKEILFLDQFLKDLEIQKHLEVIYPVEDNTIPSFASMHLE